MKVNRGKLQKTVYWMASVMLVVSMLTGCSFMKKFHASGNLVGKIELFKSVDGFEKIDDKYIPEFVETVNKKYSQEVEDQRQSGKMTIDATMDYPDAASGSTEIEMNLDADLLIEYNGGDQLMHLNMDMKMEALGQSDTYSQEGYIDFANKEQYTRVTASGAAGQWEKEKVNGRDDSESMTTVVQLTEKSIQAIYQDPETKGYAVVLNNDDESNSNTIITAFSEAFLNSDMEFDKDKAQIIMTFDDGLSYVGINSSFSDITADNYTYNKMEMSIKMEAVNEGITLKIPDEALKAGEQAGGSGILDEIGEAAEEEKEAEAASDSNKEKTEGLNTQSTEESDTEEEDSEVRQYQSGDDIPVIVNGVEIQVGKMTVQEFADATGLSIVKEDEGKVVDKDDMEFVHFVTGSDDKTLSVSANNYDGDGAKEAKECLFDFVSYMAFQVQGKDELLSVGGITIGDTEEDIVKALGESSDVYESDEKDLEFKTISYNFGNYFIEFMISEEGLVDDISVSYFDY